MTPETEKLEEALAIYSDVADIERMQAFEDKYGIEFGDVVEQAARRYAEVFPYIDKLLKIDMSSGDREKVALSIIGLRGEIVAIVARDEERKQSDD